MNKVEGWPSQQEEIWFQAGVTAERGRFTRLIQREINKLQGTPNDQLVAEMTFLLLDLIQRIKGEQK